MEREERVGNTRMANISEEVAWVCEECGYEFIIT